MCQTLVYKHALITLAYGHFCASWAMPCNWCSLCEVLLTVTCCVQPLGIGEADAIPDPASNLLQQLVSGAWADLPDAGHLAQTAIDTYVERAADYKWRSACGGLQRPIMHAVVAGRLNYCWQCRHSSCETLVPCWQCVSNIKRLSSPISYRYH